MRFFCTQPDVVEDAQEMHYRTKSSALANRSNGGHNEHTGHHGHQGHHLATNMEEGIDGLNRSRSSLSLFKGKKIFKRRGTIANPGPGIGNDSDLTSGSDAAPKKERRKSHRMSAPLNGLANATGISSLLPGQGQGHEQEDHNSGGKGNGNGYISGTDKDPKKKKRISKQTIGAPEGFRHEAHFGLGATFTKDGSRPDGWNVETWRAEIERTFKSSDTHLGRPKGPRSSGGAHPPHVGRSATIGPAGLPPTGRPVTAPDRIPPPPLVGVKPSGAGRGHSHSKSYSGSGSHARSRSPTQSQQESQPSQMPTISPLHAHLNHLNAHISAATAVGHPVYTYPPKTVYTHSKTPSNGTNGSLGSSNLSSPTSAASNSTYSTQPVITPNATGTSLSRSHSEKPYHQQHHSHHHTLSYDDPRTHAYAVNNGSLGRSSSATAALPPSLPAASSASSQSYASASSTQQQATRRPIPSQRRKPVPQHLPATAEVSPFTTLILEPRDDGHPLPDFPFESGNESKEARRDQRERKISKSKAKELVPLLGVPGEDAHYVTKSTKGRWDGAMAEIMGALRDDTAPPAIVKIPQHI